MMSTQDAKTSQSEREIRAMMIAPNCKDRADAIRKLANARALAQAVRETMAS